MPDEDNVLNPLHQVLADKDAAAADEVDPVAAAAPAEAEAQDQAAAAAVDEVDPVAPQVQAAQPRPQQPEQPQQPAKAEAAAEDEGVGNKKEGPKDTFASTTTFRSIRDTVLLPFNILRLPLLILDPKSKENQHKIASTSRRIVNAALTIGAPIVSIVTTAMYVNSLFLKEDGLNGDNTKTKEKWKKRFNESGPRLRGFMVLGSIAATGGIALAAAAGVAVGGAIIGGVSSIPIIGPTIAAAIAPAIGAVASVGPAIASIGPAIASIGPATASLFAGLSTAVGTGLGGGSLAMGFGTAVVGIAFGVGGVALGVGGVALGVALGVRGVEAATALYHAAVVTKDLVQNMGGKSASVAQAPVAEKAQAQAQAPRVKLDYNKFKEFTQRADVSPLSKLGYIAAYTTGVKVKDKNAGKARQ